MKKLSINNNKRIGQVIYVVEGDDFEGRILQHVYCNVLGYDVVSYDKRFGKCTALVNKDDKYSKVYIVPAEFSAIKKLKGSEEYFNSVYSMLAESYDLDYDNSALFFVFDRDRDSNRTGVVEKAIEKYSNARDGSGFEKNGLILLSYPSLEAVLLNCASDPAEFNSGASIKEYIDSCKLSVDGIDFSNLSEGIQAVITQIEDLLKIEFCADIMDDFKDTNKAIFDEQEKSFGKRKIYYTMSLLLLSLVELGIVEIKQNNIILNDK